MRFVLRRLLSGGRFQSDGLGMIGSRNYFYLVGKGRIRFGKKVILGDCVEIQSNGLLSIGTGTSINKYSRIVALENIAIGSYVTIAQFVTILDHDHDFKFDPNAQQLQLQGYTTAPITIGNNVWLADKCTVLKGVTIGNNVIAGAHTLINKDVPDNCIIAGTPFKILKQLDEKPAE
jgi:maltose O-acetyltransferase